MPGRESAPLVQSLGEPTLCNHPNNLP
jgi:hypothetical protein